MNSMAAALMKAQIVTKEQVEKLDDTWKNEEERNLRASGADTGRQRPRKDQQHGDNSVQD